MLEGITIAYGSQTGNAEWISSHIAHQASSRGFAVCAMTLDEFAALKDKRLDDLLVFVTSTTGDGDPPDNSTKFWRWFRRAKKQDLEDFQGRRYALLGLGDTNYTNFCNSAKRLDRKLVDLGCVPVCPKGLADDGTGLEAVVEPWIDGLFEILDNLVACDSVKKSEFESKVSMGELTAKAGTLTLKNKQGKEPTANEPNLYVAKTLELPHSVFQSTSNVTGLIAIPTHFITAMPKDTRESSKDIFALLRPSQQIDMISPTRAKLARVRCLTGASALGRVIQIELDTSTGDIDENEFKPGDSIGIVCPNPDCIIKPLLERLNLNPNQVVQITCIDQVKRIPISPESYKNVTYYEAFKYFLDLVSFPKKTLFRMLAEYCEDEKEKKWLLILSSREGTATLKAFREKHPTIADILATFSSTNPPFERLLECLLKLQPRYYSLATLKPLSIAFNVAEFKDGFDRPMRGLASGWLDDVCNNPSSREWQTLSNIEIPVFAKPTGDFALTEIPSSDSNLVLIAAGTGITPYISFLEKLAAQNFPSRVWLVYGARFDGHDVLFQDYLEELQNKFGRDKFRFDLCLSRSEKENSFKGYVCGLIEKEANLLAELLRPDTSRVFVCGSMKMSKDLHESLVSAISKSRENPVQYWQEMSSNKRYLREIWG